MALTTVARGRVYDWSHAVGRGAAAGTGFNYPQTMCLAKGGTVTVANRGNENNFGMRVNAVKIGGPGEEELLAEFFKWGEGEGRSTWPFGVAVDGQDHVYVSDEWHNTISVFDTSGKFMRKWGTAGSGDGEFTQPWGITLDQAGNIYVADWKNHRVQKLSPQGKFLMKIGEYGTIPAPQGAYAVTYMGPWISNSNSGTLGYPKAGL